MDSETALLTPPKTAVEKTPEKEHHSLPTPSADSLFDELRNQSILRLISEFIDFDELIIRKPEIIVLGNVIAFFVEPKNHLSPRELVSYINQARKAGIIIQPSEEGRRLVGYIDSQVKMNLLQQIGSLSLGLPSEEFPSLIHFDLKREMSIQGSLSIIAAARGMYENYHNQSAWRIIVDPTKRAKTGYKGTRIEPIELTDIEFSPYPNTLSDKAFEPINPEIVQTEHYDKVFAVRIDVNDFSKAFERATKEGQIKLDQDLITFFSEMEDRLKDFVILGDRTTDSLIIYYQDITAKRAIQKIIGEVVQLYNISVKSVSEEVDNVELSKIGNRVFHSTKPIDEKVWAEKERFVKNTLQQQDLRIPRYKISSHIF